EQRQKFRVADKIIPGEIDQALDRLGRREMFEVELTLLGADLLVGALEDREIEVLLVADVIIKHALVGAGLLCNAVNPRAADPVGGEFLLGGLEDAQPHTLGVALPSQNSLSLSQIGKLGGGR